jgi:hypothetical protein
MDHAPPIDQRIVDSYFQLATSRKTKHIAWLYAMIATYGIKPDDLFDFKWSGNSILIKNKKRPINPLHPQWVFLFSLKEKQPRNLRDCWNSVGMGLYRLMAYQEIPVNITDLLLAYRMRKTMYATTKQAPASSPVFAGVS